MDSRFEDNLSPDNHEEEIDLEVDREVEAALQPVIKEKIMLVPSALKEDVEKLFDLYKKVVKQKIMLWKTHLVDSTTIKYQEVKHGIIVGAIELIDNVTSEFIQN